MIRTDSTDLCEQCGAPGTALTPEDPADPFVLCPTHLADLEAKVVRADRDIRRGNVYTLHVDGRGRYRFRRDWKVKAETVARWVREWWATARVWADPELRRALRTPTTGDHGAVPDPRESE